MPKVVKIVQIDVDGQLVDAKECSKCKIIKPLSDFSASKAAKTGRQSSCKLCKKRLYESTKDTTVRMYRERNADKISRYRKEWRMRNIEHVREYGKRYRHENQEAIKENWKNYYEAHKEKLLSRRRETMPEYYERTKERFYLRNLKRRAVELSLSGELSEDELSEINERFGGKCALTGDSDIHYDHFIAISTGHVGSVKENIIPLRADLNRSKHAKNPLEWADEIGEAINLDPILEYLAELNGLSVEEYREFINWCYKNPRSADEIKEDDRPSVEIWKESKRKAA